MAAAGGQADQFQMPRLVLAVMMEVPKMRCSFSAVMEFLHSLLCLALGESETLIPIDTWKEEMGRLVSTGLECHLRRYPSRPHLQGWLQENLLLTFV